MSIEGVSIELTDGVLEVVVDRGDQNLLTSPICAGLSALLDEPPAGAHVLVLRARGEVFCLGRERNARTPSELRAEVQALIGLNEALGATKLVTVAEVHGDAAGFGVGLAALCDVALAAPSARFCFPEVSIDLAPSVVLVWLARMVGRRVAFELTATGAWIDAARARDMSMVRSGRSWRRPPRAHSDSRTSWRPTDSSWAHSSGMPRQTLASA